MADTETKEQTTALSQDALLDWYRMMVLIRTFEDNAERGYQEGKIAGYHHVYTGQEAVAVGVFAHLTPQDHIVTHYRDHGHALARGIEPTRAMAELYGRATGTSKGKGGSMHLAQRDLNFWGGYAIVGAHLSLATGIALAEQYRGTDSLVVCIFGDGSTNNGYFHESLNLAAVWKLPIIFLVENNLYGMWTPFDEVSAETEICKRAVAYGMPSKRIDGLDVMNTYEQVAEVFDHVRSGSGPYLVEALTYRFRGHGAGDIEKYRTKEEVAEYRERDSISKLAAHLTEDYNVSEEQLEKIRAEVEETIAEAVRFADESPEPELDQLWQDIYTKPFPESSSPSKGLS